MPRMFQWYAGNFAFTQNLSQVSCHQGVTITSFYNVLHTSCYLGQVLHLFCVPQTSAIKICTSPVQCHKLLPRQGSPSETRCYTGWSDKLQPSRYFLRTQRLFYRQAAAQKAILPCKVFRRRASAQEYTAPYRQNSASNCFPELVFINFLAQGKKLVKNRSFCESTLKSVFSVSTNTIHRESQCFSGFLKKDRSFRKKLILLKSKI